MSGARFGPVASRKRVWWFVTKARVPGKEETVRVFIAVLSKDGRVAMDFATSLVATQALLGRNGVGCQIATISNCTIVGHGRNRLLGQFMASDCSHILFIDDDMGWEAAAVMRLLASERPFVGCTAKRKEAEPARWACKLEEPLRRDSVGFVAATGIGMCLTLISRAAITEMVRTHENLTYQCPDTGAMLCNLFDTEIWNGQLQGNDYVFCRRWLALGEGHEIWIDPEPAIDHIGTWTWTGRLADDIRPHLVAAAE